MKKLQLLFISGLALSFSFLSCSDDEQNAQEQAQALANEQNATEQNSVPTSTLQADVEIDGATIETGNPPAPTVSMDFQLNKNRQDAYQNAGFLIQFSSNDPVAGAYIQLKDVDGNPTSNYFDVPQTSFNGRLLERDKGIKNRKLGARTTENYDFEIDVAFGNSIPAGQFCYDICLYDGQNNISQIETVCVTVEAWGGNADIVGTWVFDRYDDPIEDDNMTEIRCENGETISVEYAKNATEKWTFALLSDGSYYEQYDESGEFIDYDSSANSCTAIYTEFESFSEKYSGNWAYNEEKETLTVVDFKYEDLNDATNIEEYDLGSVYLDNVKAEVINGELVLTETNSDGSVEVYYFKKQ